MIASDLPKSATLPYKTLAKTQSEYQKITSLNSASLNQLLTPLNKQVNQQGEYQKITSLNSATLNQLLTPINKQVK